MALFFREMTIQDYDKLWTLWNASDGVGLSDADSEENIKLFLERNPGLSLVAYDGELLVGSVLCGHDGRRGYIHHLAVMDSHRRQGVASQLINRCLSSLRLTGIAKCHLFVFRDNALAIDYWLNTGWILRHDLAVCSHYTDTADNKQGERFIPV